MTDYRIWEKTIDEWLKSPNEIKFRKVINDNRIIERIIVPIRIKKSLKYKNVLKEYKTGYLVNPKDYIGNEVLDKKIFYLVKDENFAVYDNKTIKSVLINFIKMDYTKI